MHNLLLHVSPASYFLQNARHPLVLGLPLSSPSPFASFSTRNSCLIILSRPRRMSRVSRKDSFDSLDSYDSFDSYVSGDLLEAPTLSSKEIEQAREQALKVLQTESPEEANKKLLFSEGSGIKSDNQLREKVEAATTKPPKAADGKPGVGLTQTPPKN